MTLPLTLTLKRAPNNLENIHSHIPSSLLLDRDLASGARTAHIEPCLLVTTAVMSLRVRSPRSIVTSGFSWNPGWVSTCVTHLCCHSAGGC